MRKRWLLAPILAMLGALGMMAGAVMAGEPAIDDNDIDLDENGLADQVISDLAARLNVDEDEAEDALIGLLGDLGERHLERTLDQLVERGHLGEDEADEVLSWYEDRPDAADRAFFYTTLEKMERHAMHDMEGFEDFFNNNDNNDGNNG